MAKGYDQVLVRNRLRPKRGYHLGQCWLNVKIPIEAAANPTLLRMMPGRGR